MAPGKLFSTCFLESLDASQNDLISSSMSRPTMSDSVRVAQLDEIPPGGKKLLDLDGRAVALFNVDGQFYAIDDICTHDGGPLAEGELEGNEIRCPRHGARFDVRTGKALCFPAFEPVQSWPVEVRGDGIYLAISP